MDNFDTYSYARTLRFFEAYYPYDTEDVHYANVMLSMNQCKTIDELIEIRERLKEKINKLGGFLFLNKDKFPENIIEELNKRNVEELPKNIVEFKHFSTNIQENLMSDVESCYNDNVFRLFKESGKITPQTCGEAYINLSCFDENSKHKDLIIYEAKEKANIDVSDLLFSISQRYKDFLEHWKKFKEFTVGMNGYNSAKEVVEDDFEYLKKFDWRLLPEQISLYSEIDREEQKRREEHLKFLREQREERERQRQLERKLEEEKENKRESIAKKISIVIGSIILIIIIGGLFYLVSLGGGEILNWIFAIIIWLAIMKTILEKM